LQQPTENNFLKTLNLRQEINNQLKLAKILQKSITYLFSTASDVITYSSPMTLKHKKCPTVFYNAEFLICGLYLG